MSTQPEKGAIHSAPAEDAPVQEEASWRSNHEGYMTHAEMRGMYYRNEINREVLWHLVGMWANENGAMLPDSALDRAREMAEISGRRLWWYEEEERLTYDELMQLSAARHAEILARRAREREEATQNKTY